jgi:hypothetical protein
MTPEEEAIRDVVLAARKVQTFLWGKANGSYGLEEWRRMFRKRVVKLDEVDVENNPHAAIEIKKRLLQTAALAVALIAVIEEHGIPQKAADAPPSNLPQYGEKLK